jgi:hypothetical protein
MGQAHHCPPTDHSSLGKETFSKLDTLLPEKTQHFLVFLSFAVQ